MCLYCAREKDMNVYAWPDHIIIMNSKNWLYKNDIAN